MERVATVAATAFEFPFLRLATQMLPARTAPIVALRICEDFSLSGPRGCLADAEPFCLGLKEESVQI